MFGYIKSLFNKKSYPRKFTAIEESCDGAYQVNRLCGQNVATWFTGRDSYKTQFYAARTDGHYYDIKFSYCGTATFMDGEVTDVGDIVLQSRVGFADAVDIIKKYDAEAEERLRKKLEKLPQKKCEKKIARKRGRNNVHYAQKRLSISNPFIH